MCSSFCCQIEGFAGKGNATQREKGTRNFSSGDWGGEAKEEGENSVQGNVSQEFFFFF